jgi:PilZ domain-containing protein
MVNESTNRRRYSRLQLPSSKLVSLQGSAGTKSYRCTELGLGGMLLECSDPLPVGSVVRFAVEIEAKIIRGMAAVRNSTSGKMGVAFTTLSIEDRAKLRAFLDGLAARSKQVTP